MEKNNNFIKITLLFIVFILILMPISSTISVTIDSEQLLNERYVKNRSEAIQSIDTICYIANDFDNMETNTNPDFPIDAQSTTGSTPPPGYEVGSNPPSPLSGQTVIEGVPAYLSYRGCGPTAVGMIMGYWDGQGFDALVPGDASTQTSAVYTMISSQENWDDYCWPLDSYPSPIEPDKSEYPSGDEHDDNCIADFMKTSQSVYDNYYGWSLYSHVDNALIDYVNWVAPYYDVTANNRVGWSLTWTNYRQEIDANRPVILLVDYNGDGDSDHFVTAVGYDDNYNYGCYNTWSGYIQWYDFSHMSYGNPWGIYGATFCDIGGSLNQPPVADFTYLVDGFDVLFDAFSSYDPDGTIVLYEWDFGDSEYGTGMVITHTYSDYGTYAVTLTVTDNNGTTGSLTAEIEIVQPPDPNEIFSDDFQSGSLDNWVITQGYGWNVEHPAEKQVPGHSSDNLVAHADRCTYSSGCRLTLKDPLDLSEFQGATLSFWRYVDTNLDPGEFLKVEAFDGISWNTIFYWTHGAGDDDTWHHETFNLSGDHDYLVSDFSLRFVSKESVGVEETEIDDVLIIIVPPAGNNPPIANFIYLPLNPRTTDVIQFTDTSTDENGTIVSWLWDFDDSTTSDQQNPTHQYTEPDTAYEVSLTVTDNEGASDTKTRFIPVTAPQPPVADIGGPYSGFTGESITFDGSGSYDPDPDGTIVLYEWDWNNDGIFDESWTFTSEATHTFSSPGAYPVTLRVTDNDDDYDTDTTTVTITDLPQNIPPVADAGGPYSGYINNPITLDGSESYDPDLDGIIILYEWDFDGNGIYDWNSTTTGITEHTYYILGTHQATLRVTDNDDDYDTDTATVTVIEPPESNEIFFDDFQSGSLDNWVITQGYGWNVEHPAEKQVPGHSSDNLVAHADRCTYPTGCRLTLKDPIDLSGFQGATLSFWRYVDRSLDPGEFLKVEAFDGISWNTIFYWTNYRGDDDTWHHETFTFNLSSGYLVNDFSLRFVSKESVGVEETEIDDVLIEGIII